MNAYNKKGQRHEKILSFSLIVIFITQLFCVNVLASDIQDGNTNLSSNGTDILVKHRDGTEERIAPNTSTHTQSSFSNQLPYSPYIPDGLEIADSFISMSSSATRMAPAEGRVPDNLEVVDPAIFPYTTIGLVRSSNNGLSLFGTVFLLGPDLVLTAAHCVYNTETNQWHDNITFHFGVYNRSILFAQDAVSANWVSMSIQQEYVDSSEFNKQYDWAIIQIDKPLGNSRGYLGFHGCSSQENYKADMAILGYPNEKGVHESNNMEISRGSFYNTDGNCMRHRMFTVKGMSGGPAVDSGFLVYAINSYESTNSNYNGGGYMFGDYLFNLVASERNASIARWQ